MKGKRNSIYVSFYALNYVPDILISPILTIGLVPNPEPLILVEVEELPE
jgi:hypothetical protein